MSNKPLIVMARRAAVAVAATAALAGCATSTTGSVTGSNRSQLLLVSEAEMVQASQQAFNQRKSAAQSKGVLITIVWSAVVAWISYKVAGLLTGGLRVTEEAEREGLDITSHGETAYSR